MTGPKLRKYQQECKDAFRCGYSGGQRNLGASLPTGTGKSHDLETEILTTDGLRLWGDLATGDAVFGSNGHPTEVTGVYDRGLLLTYRVTMKHGETVVVDGEHLWKVKRKGRFPKVVSTQWLLTQPLKDRDGWCWSIPVIAPVVRPYRFLPLDPYVVGSLIANGTLGGSGTVLTTPDRQVIERVRKSTPVTETTRVPPACPAFYLPGLTTTTRLLGMRTHSRDKRIPRTYLEASIEQRVALLQGLMVADGSVRQGGRRSVLYSTTSHGLAEDMQELITSLGGTCSIRKCDRSHHDKPVEYCLGVLLPLWLNAFDTDRKVADRPPARSFTPRSAIVSIEPAGIRETRCISVAAVDQLYAITRAHIITHNTVIFSSMARDAHDKGNQVDVVVHRDTLVGQAHDKLLAAGIPAQHIGIVKADRNDIDAPVRVVSIHTVRNPERLRQLTRPKLSIVDEAHVSVSPGYLAYYEHIGALPGAASFDGQTFMAGFSATWMRNDNRGLGDVWQDVCFKRSMKWAVRNGFLVEPRAMQLGGNLDLSGVRTVGNPESENYGDYNTSDLADVVMVEDLLATVVQGYLKFAAGRPAVLFAPTQKSSRYFLNGLLAAGVPVAEIFAGTGKGARRWAFAAFDQGQTHILGTCTALAEGWDCPRCSVALMIRPTKSLLMFIQQVGRILRPWPGKDHGLILDFVGITDNKDMRSIVDLSTTPEAREIESPCPACGRERCLDCGLCDSKSCHMRSCVCEVEDDFERTPIPHTAKKIDGVSMVDLFAGTNARFLQTHQGIPFVQTKAHTFWVSLKDGSWAIGRCGSKTRVGGTWVATGLESAEALELASDYALNEDPTIADKRSSWRNGGGKASPQQLELVRRNRLNIPGAENMNRAALSDAISVEIASSLLAGVGSR